MGHLTGKRVLLVDDDDAQREVVEEILSLDDAEVFSAATAAQAIALLEKRPDCVLIDLHGVSVEPIVAATRQRLPGCILLLVSGDLRLQEHAIRLGVDGYLGKPYEIDDLLSAVGDAVAQRQSEGAGAGP